MSKIFCYYMNIIFYNTIHGITPKIKVENTYIDMRNWQNIIDNFHSTYIHTYNIYVR